MQLYSNKDVKKKKRNSKKQDRNLLVQSCMGSPSNVFVKKEESQSLTFGKVGEKKAVKKQYKQEAQNEITEINPNVSVIAINVNGLN